VRATPRGYSSVGRPYGAAPTLPRKILHSLFLQRQVFAVAPLSPGGVVVPHLVIPEKPQGEESVRRTDATLSIGDDFTRRLDSDLLEHSPQLGCRFELLGFAVHVVEPFEMHRSGNTAATLGSARVSAGPFAI